MMNSLFLGSWRWDADGGGDVQISCNLSPSATNGTNLDKFFKDKEAIKDKLKEVECIYHQFHESNKAFKTLHVTSIIHDLCIRMDGDIATTLKKAKLIKLYLKSLDRTNTANHFLPDCSPGTSTDRTRTSMVTSLCKKLKDSMEGFDELWKRVTTNYQGGVEWQYYMMIREKLDEEMVEVLVVTKEGKRFIQRPWWCC